MVPYFDDYLKQTAKSLPVNQNWLLRRVDMDSFIRSLGSFVNNYYFAVTQGFVRHIVFFQIFYILVNVGRLRMV